MEVKKQTYQNLSPLQRAVAAYSAVRRKDEAEIARLIGSAPRAGGHGWPIFAIGQALDAFNMLAASCVREFLLVSGKINAAKAFGEGWLAAGGSAGDPRYKEQLKIAAVLTEHAANLAKDVNAVKQAAREWCENHDLSLTIFTEPLAFLPLGECEEEVAAETLKVVREVFDAITLNR